MKKILLILALLPGLFLPVIAQTMMPIPPQNATYNGTRGFWFIAPTSFTITGLRVPTDANSNAQSIEVLKLGYGAHMSDHSNFTSLAYFQNINSTGIISTSIPVNAGDSIAILGIRGTISSYSSGGYSSSIAGKAVTLYRINSQSGPISSSQVSEIRTFDASVNYPFARTEMYYIENINVWDGISWSKGTVPTSSEIAIISSGVSPGSFTAKSIELEDGIDLHIASGDTVTLSGDITGQAYPNTDGVLSNFALNSSASNWVSGAGGTFSSSGIPANALNFDGSDDYVSVPDHADLNLSSGFTAEAWFKADALTNHASLVSKFSNNNREFSILLLNTGSIEYSISFNGSTEQYFSGSTTLSAGTWYHVALTYDGSVMRSYINGVPDGTNSVSGSVYKGNSPLYLGARSESSITRFFDGTMDEVRLWNTVRTQTEIQNAMNSEISGNESGLLAYYNFNQGTAGSINAGLDNLLNNKIISYDPNIISGNGRLIFDSSGQTLSLSNVRIEMEGVVEVTSGTTLQTNDSLTLTASSASSYGQLIGDGTVSGHVTAQAWLDVSTPRYHYLGSPFTDATLEEFNEGQTMVAANSGQGTVWQWNAATAAWEAPLALTDVAANGRGYTLYAGTNAYGSFLLGSSGVSELNGTVASGDVTVALGYHDGQSSAVSFAGGTGQSATEGWNLLANPYPSQYDWNGQSLPSGMNNAFYVNKGGAFASYVGGVGTNGGSQYLSPFQAFWVQTTSSSPGNFVFEQDQRVTAPSAALMKASPADGVFLSLTSASASDQLFIGFDMNASPGFDASLDARKLRNSGTIPNLYTQLSGEAYAICRVNPNGITSFPLSLDNIQDGQPLSFHLEADQLQAYSTVFLEDKLLNVVRNLKGADYSFNQNDSYGPGRFVLHFGQATVGLEDPVKSQAYAFASQGGIQAGLGGLNDVTIDVFNLSGQKVYHTSGESGSVRIPLKAPGIYLLRISSGHHSETLKVVH